MPKYSKREYMCQGGVDGQCVFRWCKTFLCISTYKHFGAVLAYYRVSMCCDISQVTVHCMSYQVGWIYQDTFPRFNCTIPGLVQLYWSTRVPRSTTRTEPLPQSMRPVASTRQWAIATIKSILEWNIQVRVPVLYWSSREQRKTRLKMSVLVLVFILAHAHMLTYTYTL